MRLDELEFAKVMPLPVLFSAAATMFPSELSEARMAWSKNSILTTAVDDLFDVVGSREEMENLVALIDKYSASQLKHILAAALKNESVAFVLTADHRFWACRWDAHQEVGFCSQRVEILFRAVYDTNNHIGAKAAELQNRSVIDHIAEIVSLLPV